MTAGRTQEAAERALESALTSDQRPAVEAVSIDRWPAFEAAIGAKLPRARIVHDSFHVVSHANVAVDEVRRAERRQRLGAGDETLKGSRQLWRYGIERRGRTVVLLLTAAATVAWALAA